MTTYQEHLTREARGIASDINELVDRGVDREELAQIVEGWSIGYFSMPEAADGELFALLGGIISTYAPGRKDPGRRALNLAAVRGRNAIIGADVEPFLERHDKIVGIGPQVGWVFGRLLCRLHPLTVGLAREAES